MGIYWSSAVAISNDTVAFDMRTTEAMKLWHCPESLFEREAEVEGEREITQTKQRKTNYDAEFHIRYRGGKIVKDLPIFCEKWSSK